MRKMTRALFRFLVLFVIAGAAAHAGQAKFDVTGTWTFEVTTAQGAGTPTVTLKQDGETLTGHLTFPSKVSIGATRTKCDAMFRISKASLISARRPQRQLDEKSSRFTAE